MAGLALGLITVGQAPRPDIRRQLGHHLAGVSVFERGALDGLSRPAASKLAPLSGQEPITTQMADGASITVARWALVPLIQARIEDLEADGVDAVVLACTGDFPAFTHRVPLLTGLSLLRASVGAVLEASKSGYLGILCPDPAQEKESRRKWQGVAPQLRLAYASAYSASNATSVDDAPRSLSNGASCVVLDCMGYGEEHATAVRAHTDVPVVLAGAAVGRLVGAFMGTLPTPSADPSTLRGSAGHIAELK
jgi:protein AroM